MTARQSEDATQIPIVQWLNAVLPTKEIVHVPNTPRSRIHGARLKKLGLRTGAVDLIVYVPRMVVSIEVKRPKLPGQRSGRASAAQIDFGLSISAMGHPHFIAYGIDDVRNAFKALGIETRESVEASNVARV